MTTTVQPRAARPAPRGTQIRVIGPHGPAYWLSAALAAAATAAALLTFLLPSVLRGAAVMNGSAGGTALARLMAGGPGLRGSTWLGAVGFLSYNAVLFVFATPANRLFLLYLVMLALAAWSAGAVLSQAEMPVLGGLFSPRTPVRGIAIYMWAVAGLNAAAWLARIIPAVAAGGAPEYLRGTGLATNVVYVQDLALWLPLLAVAAAWLWQRRPRGYLLAGAGLVLWGLASGSIAVDQWYGHAADPASSVASGVLVPAFAAAALIGLALVAWIAIQLLVLQRYFFLQPLIASLGAAEFMLAWAWQRVSTARLPG